MMPIGGYFELEAYSKFNNLGWHPEASLHLNSGRACLAYLITQECPTTVWIPYYCCDALIEPLLSRRIAFKYYGINSYLEIDSEIPALSDTERLLYVNYFGLKTRYTAKLVGKLGRHLWIDNTQAFYDLPLSDQCKQFNSARKFFGVPDGAFLYMPMDCEREKELSLFRNQNFNYDHLLLRSKGLVREGYPLFKENERLCGGAPRLISYFSEAILNSINYSEVAVKRRQNFVFLHRFLEKYNLLPASLFSLDESNVPLCYPFLPSRSISHRSLWEKEIFIAVYWPECMRRKQKSCYPWEQRLSQQLLPIPIDQRYGPESLQLVLDLLLSYE
jgi:hypothetical protein